MTAVDLFFEKKDLFKEVAELADKLETFTEYMPKFKLKDSYVKEQTKDEFELENRIMQ
jgi:predicted HTH domain antitoxin